MSDRLLISFATLPIVVGTVLLGLFQRPPALQVAMETRRVSTASIASGAPSKPEASAWVGVITAKWTAELAADSDGRAVEVYLRTGAHVSPGDKILELDRSEIRTALQLADADLAQRAAEVARAQSHVELLRGKLNRVTQGAEWLSEQEVEAAKGELHMAQADERAAKAALGMSRAHLNREQLRARRHTLVAPFAGTLVSADIDPGDSVSARQVLARVFSDERQVRFAMPHGFIKAVAQSSIVIRTAHGAPSVEVRVDDVRPEIDPAAQLVFATATLPAELASDPAWLPGTPVEVAPRLDLEIRNPK